jgi:CBS domain-containing protein
MDDWLEEDLALLGGESVPLSRRGLDPAMIREPIRVLEPNSPLSLPPSATVRDAIRLMRERRVGCVLIVDGERLTGIVTERDFLLKVEGDLDLRLESVMTPDPEVLRLDDPIAYALNKMSVGGFRHIPLVDQHRRPVGIVSVKDIVDYIVDLFPNDVLTVPPDPERAETWRGREGG